MAKRICGALGARQLCDDVTERTRIFGVEAVLNASFDVHPVGIGRMRRRRGDGRERQSECRTSESFH